MEAAPSVDSIGVSPSPSESKTDGTVLDGFAFEACREVVDNTATNSEQQRRSCGEHRFMSFADELFHSGRLLPLKLPPRLQTVTNDIHRSRPSSRATSPTALGSSILKKLGPEKEEFDPFMAALEKVKQEDCTVGRERGSPRRRARSLSPLRSSSWLIRRQEMGSLELPAPSNPPSNDAHPAKSIGSCRSFPRKVAERGKRRGIRYFLSWKGREVAKLSDQGSMVFEEIRKRPMKAYGQSLFVCFGSSV